jgi:transcriptional regulator with XRE-family HTH domain
MAKSLRTPQHEKLRAVLTSARTAAGLTQAELAGKLARPQSFVAKYEKGERRIDVIEFGEIAGALGRDPCKLLAVILD